MTYSQKNSRQYGQVSLPLGVYIYLLGEISAYETFTHLLELRHLFLWKVSEHAAKCAGGLAHHLYLGAASLPSSSSSHPHAQDHPS